MLSCISDFFFVGDSTWIAWHLSFALSIFAYSRKTRVRSLSSMRYMLLGYSFEPRPYSRALGTAGSVMTIGLSINGCSHSKNQFDDRELDWLVQKFGLRRLQRFDVIRGDFPESFSLPFFTRKVSTVIFSEGGYAFSRWQSDKTSNIWYLVFATTTLSRKLV